MTSEIPPALQLTEKDREASINFFRRTKRQLFATAGLLFFAGISIAGLQQAEVLPDHSTKHNETAGTILDVTELISIMGGGVSLLTGWGARRYQRSLEGLDPNIDWQKLHEPPSH